MTATPRKKPPGTLPAVTRAEFDALYQMAEQAAKDASDARAQQVEIGALIRDLHTKLMVPQPGHKEPLINRMGAVVVGIEAGDKAAKALTRAATVITALGVIFGFALFWRHTGNPPK